MTPQVSDFIPGSLEDTDKYIEVADGHHITAKKKVNLELTRSEERRELQVNY